MARALILLAVAAVVFWVFSIVDCAVQSPARHRGVSKNTWLVIVVLIPVIGGILWFAIGRTRPDAQRRGPVAPDDDPNFLGTIGAFPDQDERIRQLEEELAKLDAEDEPQPKPEPKPKDEPNGDEREGDGRDPSGSRG
jgi:hypothetical protein